MASWQQELDALVAEVRLPGAMGLVVTTPIFAVPVGPGSGKSVISFT